MTTNITLPREVVEQMTQALDLGYALLESSKSYHAPTLLACYYLGRAALATEQPAQEPLIGCVQHDCAECRAAKVPLNDEQMLAALRRIDALTIRLTPGFRAFARAIEAAHGIGSKP